MDAWTCQLLRISRVSGPPCPTRSELLAAAGNPTKTEVETQGLPRRAGGPAGRGELSSQNTGILGAQNQLFQGVESGLQYVITYLNKFKEKNMHCEDAKTAAFSGEA